jgi:cell division control protein 6
MAQQNLHDLFDDFLNRAPHFTRKDALQDTYTPSQVPHRAEQINQLAQILVSALRGEKPSNVFLYGKTGTGKTLVSRYVGEELEKKAAAQNMALKMCYINCKLDKINTAYRLFARFLAEFGEEVPPTGLPTHEVYTQFLNTMNKRKGIFILILDEIDSLDDTDILYNLSRINTELKNSRVSIIGISNDLSFTNNLDPRIKSSLSEEELVFPPYNANQISDILTQRAELALQKNILDSSVIPKCAALAAQEHGDARRALDLLRVACEIAERKGSQKIESVHVDDAQKKLDIDRVVEVVKTQPRQSQLVLHSIIYLTDLNKEDIGTGDVYEVYQTFCKQTGLSPLTQRRVSDLISELDMLSLINSSVISMGRYGRTRKIKLEISGRALEKSKGILDEELS